MQRLLRGLLHLFVDLVRDVLQHAPVEHAFVDQELGKAQHRIARGFGLALGGGLVQPLVVGKRVRIRPDARAHAPAPGRVLRGSTATASCMAR